MPNAWNSFSTGTSLPCVIPECAYGLEGSQGGGGFNRFLFRRDRSPALPEDAGFSAFEGGAGDPRVAPGFPGGSVYRLLRIGHLGGILPAIAPFCREDRPVRIE